MLALGKELVEIAKNPSGPLPASYATFVGTVSRADLDDLPQDKTPGVLKHYERQVPFLDADTLLARLQEASEKYPALEPRLRPLGHAVRERLGQAGPVYLYYSGCTISGSPTSRASDDLDMSGSLVTNLLSLWDVEQVDVYKVNLPVVKINCFEYRAARPLQLEGHSIISARYPMSLNSAPGGFAHDFRVDYYDSQPTPDFVREPVPAEMADTVRCHVEGMHRAYGDQPGHRSAIAAAALAHSVDAATPRHLLLGRVPVAAIAKDVTLEAFRGEHPDLGYRQRPRRPGPTGVERRPHAPARLRCVGGDDGGPVERASAIHRPLHRRLPPLVVVGRRVPPSVPVCSRLAGRRVD